MWLTIAKNGLFVVGSRQQRFCILYGEDSHLVAASDKPDAATRWGRLDACRSSRNNARWNALAPSRADDDPRQNKLDDRTGKGADHEGQIEAHQQEACGDQSRPS